MEVVTYSLADGGWVEFYPHWVTQATADDWLEKLQMECTWQQEQSRGRVYPRLTCWQADLGVHYRYAGIPHQGVGWTATTNFIRTRLEATLPHRWNGVLLNWYRHGQDSMGYHADDEPEMGLNPTIGSVSLGSTRRFLLRHNTTRERLTFELSHGSLLVMGGTCQHFWQHSIPKTKQNVTDRINLTFRKIVSRISV
ncbi:MAG: alpha-ketoglutarate-dependent dioxygenase AlkB [Zavarzinella sp.]